jgi:multiple sugar transport system permease protein
VVRRRLSPLRIREAIDGYLCILPWFIGFVVFIAGPMIASLYLVFLDWDIITPPSWNGMGNIVQMLDDPLFWKSLYNTMYVTFISVPLNLILSLVLAVLLNSKIRGVYVYRTLVFLPSQTPAVANAMLWMWIFNPTFGLANFLLEKIGLSPVYWLSDPAWAKPALIIMGLWGIGGNIVIYLAGLQGIPRQMYEAATIDGATSWDSFRYVTLPMMSPVIFFNLITGIIGAFQSGFTTVYIMTEGGPQNATLLYMLYLYRNGFEFFKMGYASTLAWVLFIIVGVFTLIQFVMAKKWVYYEGTV